MIYRVLSPSPVQEAFAEIRWDDIDGLEVSSLERALLSSGEENPIEYTLANIDDAIGFVRLLLQVLDQVMTPIVRRASSISSPRRVTRLGLEEALDRTAAVEYMENDGMGVVKHFVVSKLCEVLDCARSGDLQAVSIESIFFPHGFLLEGYKTLMQVLDKGGSDLYTQRGAAFCLGSILTEGIRLEKSQKVLQSVQPVLEQFIAWTATQLQSSGSKPLSIVLPALMVLIPDAHVRNCLDRNGGIGCLSRHLRFDHLGDTRATVQQMYELSFCLWLMSYDVESSDDIRNHFHADGAVGVLCDLVASSPREKVVRCALATLRNLAECKAIVRVTHQRSGDHVSLGNRSEFLHEMVGCGLMKTLETLKNRQWTDPDIWQDLDFLYSSMHDAHSHLSRFDVYQSEVEAGHLQWGLVHTEKFFRENAKLMEGPKGDFALVKRLISLIKTSRDDDIVSIACYDLGEFVRFYPNGRMVAKSLGAREIVLLATEHANPDVQTQALLCISKILVQNWAAIR